MLYIMLSFTSRLQYLPQWNICFCSLCSTRSGLALCTTCPAVQAKSPHALHCGSFLLHTNESKADAIAHTILTWLSLSGRAHTALQNSRETANNASCLSTLQSLPE